VCAGAWQRQLAVSVKQQVKIHPPPNTPHTAPHKHAPGHLRSHALPLLLLLAPAPALAAAAMQRRHLLLLRPAWQCALVALVPYMLSVTESDPTSSGGNALATAMRASSQICTSSSSSSNSRRQWQQQWWW
jgi:hypothetical protein